MEIVALPVPRLVLPFPGKHTTSTSPGPEENNWTVSLQTEQSQSKIKCKDKVHGHVDGHVKVYLWLYYFKSFIIFEWNLEKSFKQTWSLTYWEVHTTDCADTLSSIRFATFPS